MLSTQLCEMMSSIVERSLGFGSSIFLMTGRHALGDRLLMVGGHDACAGVDDWHAAA